MISTKAELEKVNVSFVCKHCNNVHSILDLGSGTSIVTPKHLFKHFDLLNYVAIDKEPNEESRFGVGAKHKFEHKYFHFFETDIHEYLSKTDKELFDLVILSKVLNRNEGKEKDIIDRALLLLNDGGYLFLRINGTGYRQLTNYSHGEYTIDTLNGWIKGLERVFIPEILRIKKNVVVEEYVTIIQKKSF